MSLEEKYGTPFNPMDSGAKVEEEVVEAPVETEAQATEPAEAEAPVVETAEKTKDGTAEKTSEAEPVEPEKEFDTAFFNKSFGTQFSTPDEIKGLLESSDKVKELEGKVTALDELQTKYDEINQKYETYKRYEEELFDPMQYFNSPEEYAWMKYRKDNPDKDASIAYKAFVSDFKKDSDLDVLINYERFSDPGLEGGEQGVKEMIADKYGIDPELIDSPSEWTTVVRNKIRKDANLARKEFEEIKSSVELPAKVDINKLEADRKVAVEAKTNQLKKDWSEITNLMLKDMDKVTVFDDPNKEGKSDPLVDFVLDDKMKSELREGMISYLTDSGLEPTESNIQEAGTTAQARVILQNLPKIIKGAVNEALAKQEKAHNDEIHNPAKVTTDVKPDADSEKARIREFALQSPYPSARKPVINF